MTCCQLCDLLGDFLAHELSQEQQEFVQSHLDGCPCCATYFETYCLTVTISGKLSHQPMPADLIARVRSALGQPSGPSASA